MRTVLTRLLSAKNYNTKYDDLALASLRIFIGLTMAFSHGLGKMPPPEGFVTHLQMMGFPAPDFLAWCAALAELMGGLFLAAGLLTRPSALFVMITMAVAAFGAHGADPFAKKEMALLYLFASLFFVLHGAGRWSVDHWLSKYTRSESL
ncbi:DoxX family protein [Bdellovibrio reynosensis]|uniref:DoxX family protein n=1 Tax=Bdellovibrio reynosensis TaxID=2835041 RepID=A0ABY4CC31_9BACT|nr:DoxX family protein [Bdellovibrio reynosensis]UOE99754.1 DoxX family protein [Bdellovibrio reynosensis]